MDLTSNAGAERLAELDVSSSAGCTRTVVANCVVTECNSTDKGPLAPALGKVTVSSTTLGSVDLVADTMGYARVVQPGSFPAGEEITFKSAGDKVPAFEAKVTMPGVPASVTVGGCPAGGKGTCALNLKQSPFATWVGASGGEMSIGLRFPKSGGTVSAACRYPGASGAGKLPAEVAAKLPAGAVGSISLSATSTAVVDAGTHRTTIEAKAWPTGWSTTATIP